MKGIATVVRRRFTSTVCSSTLDVDALVVALVPAADCERDPKVRTWCVHGSGVPALLAALRARGVEVVEKVSR